MKPSQIVVGGLDDDVEIANIDVRAANAEGKASDHDERDPVDRKDGGPADLAHRLDGVLNALKQVPEACAVHCATANAVEVIVAETDLGRAIVGVVDGMPPSGVENDQDGARRKQLLRELGYKL